MTTFDIDINDNNTPVSFFMTPYKGRTQVMIVAGDSSFTIQCPTDKVNLASLKKAVELIEAAQKPATRDVYVKWDGSCMYIASFDLSFDTHTVPCRLANEAASKLPGVVGPNGDFWDWYAVPVDSYHTFVGKAKMA